MYQLQGLWCRANAQSKKAEFVIANTPKRIVSARNSRAMILSGADGGEGGGEEGRVSYVLGMNGGKGGGGGSYSLKPLPDGRSSLHFCPRRRGQFAAFLFRVEDLPEHDFGLARCDFLKSRKDLKQGLRIPLPSDRMRWLQMREFAVVFVMACLRTVHHKAPTTADAQVEFVEGIGEAMWTPPDFQ